MAEDRVFDVDALRARAAGRIKVNGKSHDVLQITGALYQSLKSQGNGDMTESIFRTAAKCVPTLTEDEVAELTISQAAAIASMAGGGIDAVEKLYPNGSSPETASSAPSTSLG